MSKTVQEMLHTDAALVEESLDRFLSEEYSGSTALRDAMCYSVLGGGKRVRGFLTIEFCRLFGGDAEAALPFAAAIEMVHAYSLVHDDMPCMDNDGMRRGKPSCHRAYGEANALLAGDTLLTQAFQVLADNALVSESSRLMAVHALACGAGALGMCGGQYYDLSTTCASFAELHRLQAMKTGALIRTACLFGYYAACGAILKADEDNILQYADGIGFAFQIIDDILDVRSDPKTLGKPTGSDEKNGKKTILSFRSEEEAFSLAKECTENAKAAIRIYNGHELLSDFADYLLNRTF